VERSERGFTLVEVVIGVAIIATTAAAGIAISLAARPAVVSAAAARFDALLDAARTEARAFDSGVTIAFTPLQPDPAIDGFRARLYRNRPAVGALVAMNLPNIEASVALRESETLGAPAFALTIHHDGRITGILGYTPAAQSSSPETGCPASGSYHLTFTAAGGHADRYIPCRITLAATGPVAYATIPPAANDSPPPTNGCSGGPCSSPPPALTSTCPPNSFLNGTACIDSPLVVSPSSLLFLHPNAPAQSVSVSESSYSGPIALTSTTCKASDVAISGGGTGPSTSFSVTSSQAGTCSFIIADNHGGTQTVHVTTYGVLTVSPTSLVFPSPSARAQMITGHEDYYSGVISTSLTLSDAGGDPGCAPYASIDSAGRNTDSSWNVTFAVLPQRALLGQCEVTLRDDHGGMVQVPVVFKNPTMTCPDGTVVGLGTPCPAATLASQPPQLTFSYYSVTISCDYAEVTDIQVGGPYLTAAGAVPRPQGKDRVSPDPSAYAPSTPAYEIDYAEYVPAGGNQCIGF
jgi:prepilin-type N-terminal cleavage/methylation domain-containing protein